MEKYITHYNYLQMLYSWDKPQNYNQLIIIIENFFISADRDPPLTIFFRKKSRILKTLLSKSF